MEGKKDDGYETNNPKLKWNLLPYTAIEKIVEILTFGATKYGENNWQTVESKRYEAALMRHFVDYMKGEENDKESGFNHLAHMACNAIFLLWQDMNRVRPQNPEDSIIKKPKVNKKKWKLKKK